MPLEMTGLILLARINTLFLSIMIIVGGDVLREKQYFIVCNYADYGWNNRFDSFQMTQISGCCDAFLLDLPSKISARTPSNLRFALSGGQPLVGVELEVRAPRTERSTSFITKRMIISLRRTCYNLFTMTNQTRYAHDNINSHLVWCPKYRRPVLAGDVGPGRSCVEHDRARRSFASFPPTMAINPIMHRLRKEFPHLKSRLPSLWPHSYYAGTAGHVSAETIQR